MCFYIPLKNILPDIMKKIFITLVVAMATFGFAKAQSGDDAVKEAVDLYNEAATLLNEPNNDYAGALPKFLECLEKAKAIGEEAVNVVNDCQEVIPKIYWKLAEADAGANEFDSAIENCRRAIETSTEYCNNDDIYAKAEALIPQVFMAKGSALINIKDFAGAVAAFKEVVAVDSTNTKALMRLGQSYFGSGDLDSAIDVFTNVATLGEGTNFEKDALKQVSNCYLKKAVACQKAKDNRGAMENAQRSAQAMDSPNAQKLIGMSALNLKQYDVAVTAFEAYLAQSPNANDKGQIIYQLADACEKRKDRAKACGYYKQILNDPKFGAVAKFKVEEELKCNQ